MLEIGSSLGSHARTRNLKMKLLRLLTTTAAAMVLPTVLPAQSPLEMPDTMIQRFKPLTTVLSVYKPVAPCPIVVEMKTASSFHTGVPHASEMSIIPIGLSIIGNVSIVLNPLSKNSNRRKPCGTLLTFGRVTTTRSPVNIGRCPTPADPVANGERETVTILVAAKHMNSSVIWMYRM